MNKTDETIQKAYGFRPISEWKMKTPVKTKKLPRYILEEELDAAYIYKRPVNAQEREDMVWGRHIPICQIIERHPDAIKNAKKILTLLNG